MLGDMCEGVVSASRVPDPLVKRSKDLEHVGMLY